MASTYSTNLKLELIASGEQSGTWGNSTNNNVGTLIEQSIVGSGSVVFTADADMSVSISDGATSAARCVVLSVASTTSLTATRNLTVPTINKPYVVYNNTSGSQSIVVKTSAGTGITIPNGKRRAIYADATNVVDYINDLPSTVTFAGTFLPVAQGGTGGTTAAAARSALGAAASGANSDITSLTGLTTPLSIAQGGTAGAVSPVAGSVSYGTGSAYAFTAAGTVGQVLTSNGASAPTWTTDAAGTTIPSGTVMLFAQTNAPTGFTKITAHNNKALRLVSGTASSGGSIAFTTAFGSQNVGSTTLSTSQIPAHTHTYTGADGASAFPAGESSTASAVPSSSDTGSTGGGSSHTHTLDISVSYVDVILASKD